MSDRRRLSIELVTASAALSAVGAALLEANDPEDASSAVGVVLVLLGLALVPVRAWVGQRRRWRLVLSLVGGFLCWLVGWYGGVALVQFT
jgi:hypothetical protein